MSQEPNMYKIYNKQFHQNKEKRYTLRVKNDKESLAKKKIDRVKEDIYKIPFNL